MKIARLLLVLFALVLFVNKGSMMALEDRGDRTYSPDGKWYLSWMGDSEGRLFITKSSDESRDTFFLTNVWVLNVAWSPESNVFAFLTYNWLPNGNNKNTFPFSVYTGHLRESQGKPFWEWKVYLTDGLAPYDLYWYKSADGMTLALGDYEKIGCYQVRTLNKDLWQDFRNTDEMDFYRGDDLFRYNFSDKGCRISG